MAAVEGGVSVFEAEQERVVWVVGVDLGGVGDELVVLARVDPQVGGQKHVARGIKVAGEVVVGFVVYAAEFDYGGVDSVLYNISGGWLLEEL